MTLRVRLAAAVAAVAGAAAIAPVWLAPPTGVESWLMFDGVCNLCDGFVNFVAAGDSARNVKFGALQKHTGLLERVGAPTDLSTLVLIQGDAYYTHSSAALRTLALMDYPYKALALGAVVPRPIRDAVYRLVAAHRYEIFGKAESCREPTTEFRQRFIDYRPEEAAATDPIADMLEAPAAPPAADAVPVAD